MKPTQTQAGTVQSLISLALVFTFLQVSLVNLQAGTAQNDKKKPDSGEEIQRTPTGEFDLQRNVVSNINFYTTNYGIFGLDVANNRGGTLWPRGLRNQYLFAGGVWFGAIKKAPGSSTPSKHVTISYNPNSGLSWMVPGSIDDGPDLKATEEGRQKYRTYFSPDFSSSDGTDFANPSYPAWPIWDSSPSDELRVNNYFGYYINDISKRNRSAFVKGPAYVSEEDVFAVYKDTDLSRYEGGATRRKNEGYPLGLQIEQMIYTWGFGDYADMVFLKYVFIHPSSSADTLQYCWMASLLDVDISLWPDLGGAGAQNDRARKYSEEDTLNLAVQWTDGNRGEAGKNFGYVGFNFLESPAVDSANFLRKDKKQFAVTEQLGLRSYRAWPIALDPLEDEERYNFISSNGATGDEGPADRRMLLATGPFHMRPGDSARIVVGIILATTASGKDATGTPEDMTELIRKVRFAQFVYNNQFRAPKAPDLANIKGYQTSNSFTQIPSVGWMGLNNAVLIQWDSTSELSIDTLERGLDFMGYRVYRARRTDLDTFSVNYVPNERTGPLAWKQIAEFAVPSPFRKSEIAVPKAVVYIDDFEIAEQIDSSDRKFLVSRQMSLVAPWYNIYFKLLAKRPQGYGYYLRPNGDLDVSRFDKLDSITYTYFTTQFDALPEVKWTGSGNSRVLDPAAMAIAKDSLIKLILDKKVKMQPFLFSDTVQIKNPDGSTTVQNIRRPFEETSEVRYGLIAPYMSQITTRGRTFIDFGDDDKDGNIVYNVDPEKSEKLINNVEYYYTVRAFDEGDYLQHTASKLNNRAIGLPNTVTTMPLAARSGKPAEYEFFFNEKDGPKIGGLYNFRLLINDEQRFNQLFAGRTLELELFRDWFPYDADRLPATDPIGMYAMQMVLRDSASKDELARWSTALPPKICGNDGLTGYFTEDAMTYIDTSSADTTFVRKECQDTCPIYRVTLDPGTGDTLRVDTITFHLPWSKDNVVANGTNSTVAVCLSNDYAYGVIGLTFDFAIQQWGGTYRSEPLGEIVSGGDPNIYVGMSQMMALVYNETRPLNQPSASFEPPFPEYRSPFPWPRSYNNGPGIYEITFTEGGTETIRTPFRMEIAGTDPYLTFENVPYLNMSIRNVLSFERPQVNTDGTTSMVTVNYPFDLSAVSPSIDSTQQLREYPNPELVPLGSYAVAAYGWRNSQNGDESVRNRPLYAADSNSGNPLGTNRYYRSRNISTSGTDTLDFLHVLSVAGAQFTIDFSGKGRRSTAYNATAGNATKPTGFPTTDFKAGDKIRFFTYGGAFGYPFDSTKAYIRIKQYDPEITGSTITDQNLEQVQVVPNPYYVTHEGVVSTFQGKLYFTRLPRKATIKIYTINGDLVKTFNHDESTSTDPSTFTTEVWDLLTPNRQRVASQMFVALIETPDGASVTRKFTIVVGPARLPTED